MWAEIQARRRNQSHSKLREAILGRESRGYKVRINSECFRPSKRPLWESDEW